MLRVYRLGFAAGRELERAEADERVQVAEATADYWYFIARNPAEQHRVIKNVLSWREILERRAEQEQLRQQWDAQEQALIEQAAAMIWAGKSDLEIAVELGLFLPMVASTRDGSLS